MKRYKVTTKVSYFCEGKDEAEAQYNFIMHVINHIIFTGKDGEYIKMIDPLDIEEIAF